MRKLRVMLEIEVADLSTKERELLAAGLKIGERELPRAETLKAADVAKYLTGAVIAGHKTKGVELKTSRVISAAWFGS